MNHIVHTSFSHLSIDFNLKIIIKSKFRTLSKKLGYKTINCVGVQTFGIENHKCSNVEISHSFMP